MGKKSLAAHLFNLVTGRSRFRLFGTVREKKWKRDDLREKQLPVKENKRFRTRGRSLKCQSGCCEKKSWVSNFMSLLEVMRTSPVAREQGESFSARTEENL